MLIKTNFADQGYDLTSLAANDPLSPDTAGLGWSQLPPAPIDVCATTTVAIKAATPAAPATALFLTEAGDTAAISVNDLHQGQIGDCFLVASIGEMALFHPTAISNMIKVNADGTETVTLYTDKTGAPVYFGDTAFKAKAITINNVFQSNAINNGATQDVVGGTKEIWGQVMEKAVATLDGGYGAISNGGNPMIAMEQLTGHSATAVAPAGLTAAALQQYVAAGDLITMDTGNAGGLPFGLVSSHAYMFEKIVMSGTTASVQLGNPWGIDQPQLIPLSQLSKGIVEVDIGRFS